MSRGLGDVYKRQAEKMVTVCQELVGYLEDIEGAAVIQREIASIAMEMKEIIQKHIEQGHLFED